MIPSPHVNTYFKWVIGISSLNSVYKIVLNRKKSFSFCQCLFDIMADESSIMGDLISKCKNHYQQQNKKQQEEELQKQYMEEQQKKDGKWTEEIFKQEISICLCY